MRGTINWQVTEVYKSIDDIGTSKHEAKELARGAGAKTWEDLGQAIGTHSYSTRDDYIAYSKDMASWVKDQYGVRDITKIQTHHAEAWFKDKFENGGRAGDGISRATFDTYGAAIAKFESAISKYCEAKGIDRGEKINLKEVRGYAKAELGLRNKDSRAYKDPKALVAATPGKYNLLAKIILESGARISEGGTIKAEQLLGIKEDKDFKVPVGVVKVYGKGGKPNELKMTPGTYAELVKAVESGNGTFHINQGNFREKLAEAAKITGQKYEGPHGLRWSYAQRTHADLQKIGLSYEASLSEISNRMTHERSDISLHYLH